MLFQPKLPEIENNKNKNKNAMLKSKIMFINHLIHNTGKVEIYTDFSNPQGFETSQQLEPKVIPSP